MTAPDKAREGADQKPAVEPVALIERLRTKADTITMGEKIAWGSETALMREAAALLEQALADNKRLREALEPFADAAGGIPSDHADARPAANVNNDARHPGSITSLATAFFRRARTALGDKP